MKRLLSSMILVFGLLEASGVYAGIPVIDVGNIAATAEGAALVAGTTSAGWAEEVVQFSEEVAKWVEEKEAWIMREIQGNETITSIMKVKGDIKSTMEKLDGLRNAGQQALATEYSMGDGYLPDNYQDGKQYVKTMVTTPPGKNPDLLSTYQAHALEILSAAGITSDEKLDEEAVQASLNLSLAELAYKQASARMPVFKDFQEQIDGQSLDLKATADISARLQAEQALLQNDQIKVASLTLLERSQAAVQQAKQKNARLQSLQMDVPSVATAAIVGWVF